MSFLRDKDYAYQIESDFLGQITPTLEDRQQAEAAAIREASNYLRHRYDVAKIFIDVTAYAIDRVIKKDQVLELKAAAYDIAINYAVDKLVSYQADVYKKKTTAAAGTTPAQGTDWDKIGKQEGIYTALADQTAGSYPSDDTKFTYGDPRDPQILMYAVDMTLYHLHSSVTPRQIPVVRAIRYDGNSPDQKGGAIGWLKRAGRPDGISPDLPLLTNPDNPDQGKSIRFGSECKQDNDF